MTAAGIPASSLIPPAFDADRPDWIWEPKFLKEGETRKLYMTSEIFSGWRYFTMNNEVRLSQKQFPVDSYIDEIGYAFGHGPGKTDKEGKPAENKAKPRGCWLFRAWLAEDKKMVAFVSDNYFVHQGVNQELSNNSELLMLSSGISNFYLEIKKTDSKVPSQAFYIRAHLRPCGSKDCLAQLAQPFFPDRYWMGLNPLEAGAEPPPNAGKPRLPATARDGNGAEEEVALQSEGGGDDDW
jgi:hypothetical protein